MPKHNPIFHKSVHKELIYHLTKKELQDYGDRVAEQQRLHDQEVLDRALLEQVEIDSGRDFQYFYTITFYILWTKFRFRKKRMDMLYEEMQKAFDNPASIEEMQRLLKDEADIEISEISLKEVKE